MPLRTSFYRKQSSGRWPTRISKHLSVNMISRPLADFRHVSHIGPDASRDSFGDLSFLKMGHSLLLQSSLSEQNLFMACSPPPKPPRLNVVETEGSKSPDWSVGHQNSISQKRKKCSSLPLLDSEEGGEVETDHTASTQPLRDGVFTDTCVKTAGQTKEEDNGFSFSLDLGPSILDDVLQVMDKLYN